MPYLTYARSQRESLDIGETSAEVEARIEHMLSVGVGENPRESLSESEDYVLTRAHSDLPCYALLTA